MKKDDVYIIQNDLLELVLKERAKIQPENETMVGLLYIIFYFTDLAENVTQPGVASEILEFLKQLPLYFQIGFVVAPSIAILDGLYRIYSERIPVYKAYVDVFIRRR